jgi:hypothetical protein
VCCTLHNQTPTHNDEWDDGYQVPTYEAPELLGVHKGQGSCRAAAEAQMKQIQRAASQVSIVSNSSFKS